MSTKIISFSAENVKRIRAVAFEPTQNGLTVIGGNNANGKTSVLDAIAWALGGNKFAPANPTRDGSVTPPEICITLSNGLTVERKGKNSELKITDPTGTRSGQKILDEIIGQLALDLPKFLVAGEKEKADILLRILGVGDKLQQLEQDYKSKYAERREVGRIADSKRHFAEGMPSYPDAPDEPVSAAELIARQSAILAKNGENQRLRLKKDEILSKLNRRRAELDALMAEVDTLSEQAEAACKAAENLQDESTAELQEQLENIEAVNAQVRANLEKSRADDEATYYSNQYSRLTAELDGIQSAKAALLQSAALPLPELTVENGVLLYKGHSWDCMSSAEQLKVAAAIVQKTNPACGFLLLDQLEKMDIPTLGEFSHWAEEQNLQIIATRVSTGKECSLIIEDGRVAEPQKTYTKGVF